MKGPSLKVFSFTNPPGFFGSGRTPMPAGEEGRNASETLQKRPISAGRNTETETEEEQGEREQEQGEQEPAAGSGGDSKGPSRCLNLTPFLISSRKGKLMVMDMLASGFIRSVTARFSMMSRKLVAEANDNRAVPCQALECSGTRRAQERRRRS